nr:MAG TPA: hypothetical protein [Caudoviricetes sp.]
MLLSHADRNIFRIFATSKILCGTITTSSITKVLLLYPHLMNIK